MPMVKPQASYTDGTYIVVFNDSQNLVSAMDDQVAAFAEDNNATVKYTYNLINGMAITVPTAEAAAKLSTLKGVKYVEKNVVFHTTLDVAAPLIGAPQVWDMGYTGKGVKVALVDTGIDGTHPDLTGRIVEWKDFVNGKTTPYDDYGHGTHCAGIIGGDGKASNGKYTGIAPNVSYIGIKVLDSSGSGSLDNIIAGLNYAAQSDARVISMSLGSTEHTQSMDDAVTAAVKAGKIVVVAAGNSGPGSSTICCPADSPDAITIGATDKSDVIASFSSRGPNSDGTIKPDVTAPGVDIVSCRAANTNDDKAIDTYYLQMSGTSMATPMVSGAIADMLQLQPNLTDSQVRSILEKTAKPLGSGVPNNDYGYGRISVINAINYLKGNYTPPTNPSPTPTPTPTPVNPTPTPTPTPTPGYPSYPYPGYPGTPVMPKPIYPGYPYPVYPYPSYPYPGYPGSTPSHPGSTPSYPGYPVYTSPVYPTYPGSLHPGYIGTPHVGHPRV